MQMQFWEQSKGNPIEIDGLWGIAFLAAASLNITY
jgi:hypothetical protein